MTVFQAKDGLRFICLATLMHLHDRAGKLASLLLYKAEKPSVRLSVCPSALFVRSGSQPWLHGSTSDLLDVIATSSGMTKFIFKSF